MLFADTCRRHGSESYVECSFAGGAIQLLGSRLGPYPEFSVATGALDLDLVRLLYDSEDSGAGRACHIQWPIRASSLHYRIAKRTGEGL